MRFSIILTLRVTWMTITYWYDVLPNKKHFKLRLLCPMKYMLYAFRVLRDKARKRSEKLREQLKERRKEERWRLRAQFAYIHTNIQQTRQSILSSICLMKYAQRDLRLTWDWPETYEKRWRFSALEHFVSNWQTDGHTKWLLGLLDGAKKQSKR